MAHILAALMPEFQSTPSARRATNIVCAVGGGLLHFNPRPPRGGRPSSETTSVEGRIFQSTPSARRATGRMGQPARAAQISIHALREEGDVRTPTAAPTLSYFNPRPPRGGRPVIRAGDAAAIPISIHALREEGDSVPGTTSAPAPDFNPRPPRGGRRTDCPARQQDNDISIHALREEGDALPEMSTSLGVDFNPRPPRGGRQQKRRKNPPRLFHYTHLCTI